MSDLDAYTLALGHEYVAHPVRMATDCQVVATPEIGRWDWPFINRGEPWVARYTSNEVNIVRLETNDEEVKVAHLDFSDLGWPSIFDLEAVTADPNGTLWFAFAPTGSAEIQLTACDPLACTDSARQLTVSGQAEYADDVLLAAGQDVVYVGTTAFTVSGSVVTLLAIDAENGSTVTDYQDSIAATLLRQGHTPEAIALTDSQLLVQLADRSEFEAGLRAGIRLAYAFDLESGALVARVPYLPAGRLVGAFGSALFSAGEGVAMTSFSLEATPLPSLGQARAVLPKKTGAVALTATPDRVWLYYHDIYSAGELIGYDPASLEPMEGFVLDIGALMPNTTQFLAAVTASDSTFYVQTAPMTIPIAQTAGVDTSVHLVDIATGTSQSSYTLTGVPSKALGICYHDDSLWLAAPPTLPELTLEATYGLATVYRLDPATGHVQDSFEVDVPMAAPGIACGASGILLGSSANRVLVRLPDADPEQMELVAGAADLVDVGGVWDQNRSWFVDRQHGWMDVLNLRMLVVEAP